MHPYIHTYTCTQIYTQDVNKNFLEGPSEMNWEISEIHEFTWILFRKISVT